MRSFFSRIIIFPFLLTFLVLFCACSENQSESSLLEIQTISSEPASSFESENDDGSEGASASSLSASDVGQTPERLAPNPPGHFTIPEYEGVDVVELDDNRPYFTQTDLVCDEFIEFSELDSLGRCGAAVACIGRGLLPTEERGQIGMVRPSGWQMAKYDFIDGNYLFNRCHLIAYELCGVNDDERNLVTGTRNLNVSSMLPIENRIADYVLNTGNHVCYRVTPWYNGDDLVAAGIQIEAYSIEDHGEAICMNVFCHNVQYGVIIDYLTGESMLDENLTVVAGGPSTAGSESASEENESIAAASESSSPEEPTGTSTPEVRYILNTNSKKFHYPYCSSVNDMKEKNKQEFTGTRDEVISKGYKPCGRCKP